VRLLPWGPVNMSPLTRDGPSARDTASQAAPTVAADEPGTLPFVKESTRDKNIK